MTNMIVFRVGSEVDLGSGIKARIIAISIKEKGIQYQCRWWDNRTVREDWFQPFEIILVSGDKPLMNIGFAPSEDKEPKDEIPDC